MQGYASAKEKQGNKIKYRQFYMAYEGRPKEKREICTCTQIQTCFSKGILVRKGRAEKNAIEGQPSATLL